MGRFLTERRRNGTVNNKFFKKKKRCIVGHRGTKNRCVTRAREVVWFWSECVTAWKVLTGCWERARAATYPRQFIGMNRARIRLVRVKILFDTSWKLFWNRDAPGVITRTSVARRASHSFSFYFILGVGRRGGSEGYCFACSSAYLDWRWRRIRKRVAARRRRGSGPPIASYATNVESLLQRRAVYLARLLRAGLSRTDSASCG